MLRLLERQRGLGEKSLSVRHLVDDLYVKELRDGRKMAVYDFSLSRKTKEKEVTSEGLLKDLAALSAAGLVEVKGDNPHVSLTSRGLELASKTQLPKQVEHALSVVPNVAETRRQERTVPLRRKISHFLDYLTYI
jgi:hypothetical protein